jgi:DNA polymerase I
MDKQEELEFYSCNPELGGTPLCKLGILTDDRGNKYAETVQLRGASLREVLDGRRLHAPRKGPYDMFIIGEAPGMKEDAVGLPFQGKAGVILAAFINDSGIDLDRTYVTNLVKCRPPKNRRPAVKEIQACHRHIQYELMVYKPKVILLLGTSTLKLFNLDKLGGITAIHGQLYEKPLPSLEDGPSFKVIPTYHPAAFLHSPNPKLQRRVRDDYIFARRVLEAKEGEKVHQIHYTAPYKVIDSIESLDTMIAVIREKQAFAFDTESCNLNFMISPMICAQFSIGQGQTWVLPFYTHDPDGLDWKLKPGFGIHFLGQVIERLRTIFEAEDVSVIAHNIKYDRNVIKRWLGLETKGWWWDTMAMHHLINCYRPHGLEILADIEFAVGNYSEKVHDIVGRGRELIRTFDWIPDHILHPYGATDADVTWRLFEVYVRLLQAKPHLLKLYEEETHDALKALAQTEWDGVYIITDTVEKLGEEFDGEIDRLKAECQNYTSPEFNPGSPDDVAAALIKLGYSEQVQKKEAAKGFTTAKDILVEIDHPLAAAVLKYRHVKKFRGTYVDYALETVDENNRIRVSFNIPGTTSGRLSCRFLHQIPTTEKERDEEGKLPMRAMFGEEEGFVYFYADYSQIELRIFAIITREQELINALYKSPTEDNTDKNSDIHKITAAGALGVRPEDVSDFNRTNVGKRLNFGTIYGSEGYSIAKGIFENPLTNKKEVIGIDRALNFVRNFRYKYRKVNEFLEATPEIARCQGGLLRSCFGREMIVHGLNDENKYVRAHAERTGTNFLIQSPAGAITLRTINLVAKLLEQHDVGSDLIRLSNTVHDSMSYGVRKDMVDWFTPVFKQIAQRPIPEINNYFFPVKIGVGRTWAEAEIAA